VSTEILFPNFQSALGFPACRHYNGALLDLEIRRRKTLASSPTSGDDDVTQEQFDELLHWLNPDREKAAAHYEWIRKRLIKIFVSRGSHIPEELADNTINRVARKLPEIRDTYVGEPAHYFSGVASYIWRESLRKEKVPAVTPPSPSVTSADEERDYACLEKCLAKLPSSERDLAVSYYQHEKHAKIDHRKKLAEQFGLAINALRIRACRIRVGLLKCVEICRSESG
jgi:DNA-directed RNA polymerase specialized sigma24 family protein